jgi:hypothetical protein
MPRHRLDCLRRCGREGLNAPSQPTPRYALQVYEDELVILQPSPSVENISLNAAPPLRVNSRNVPRRSSFGLTYEARRGGPRPS